MTYVKTDYRTSISQSLVSTFWTACFRIQTWAVQIFASLWRFWRSIFKSATRCAASSQYAYTLSSTIENDSTTTVCWLKAACCHSITFKSRGQTPTDSIISGIWISTTRQLSIFSLLPLQLPFLYLVFMHTKFYPIGYSQTTISLVAPAPVLVINHVFIRVQ